MQKSKALRVALDIALTAMLVFEMFIQFTGTFLHEVVGFAFFATVIAHLALAGSWIKKTARNAKTGRLTARRKALAAIGSLLAITTVLLGVSSVAISNILASAGLAWTLGSYALWTSIHTYSAYALCALVVVHLAMHWAFLALTFKVQYDPSRRRAISAGVNALAAVGVVALGVAAANAAMPQVSSAAQESTGDVSGGSAGSSAGGSAGTSSNSESSAFSDANGRSLSSGGPSGKKDRNDSSGSSSSSVSDGGSAGSSAGTAPQAPPSGGASESNSAGNGTGGSSTEGICTLCKKRCSLSSPRCNKPYEAGLL